MEQPKLHRPSSLQDAPRSRGSGGSTHLAEFPFGVETSSPSEDQGIRLALATTAPDDKVTAATHGPGLFRGLPAVRKGCGGLLAPILRLPPGSRGVAGDGRRLSRSDFGGGVLAVSHWRIIPSRS